MAVQTVLDIVTAACYEINEPAPGSLYNSTDQNARQWLHIFYAVGRDVRNRFDYPTLKRKYQFSTVSGQKEYPLPGDFWRLLLDTQWDETNDWALFGPEDDGGIVGRDLGVVPYGTQYSYRVRGAIEQGVDGIASFDRNSGYFEISPTPTEARDLYIEYISANWFYPTGWAPLTPYNLNDLVSASGNIYKVTAGGTSNSTRPSGESTTTLETDVAFQVYRDHYNVIGADTDFPIIDPEVMIAGLRAKFPRKKGLTYVQEANDFELAILNSMTRFNGASKVNGDGPDVYEFPNVSEGFVSTGW